MTSVVFYFQVHQPYRVLARAARSQELEDPFDLFDTGLDRLVLDRVAERCYQPMNQVLLEAIRRTDGAFRCAFSFSGTVLEQLETWSPETLESFQALVDTGHVEVLGETSMHSMAFLEDELEWVDQVGEHGKMVHRLFGVRPTTFRNTELVISGRVAQAVEQLGFDLLLGEGIDWLLDRRSPHHLWRPAGCSKLRLLLRDYRFSDDIAFRFSNPSWESYPLLAPTFAEWLGRLPESSEAVGLFMDYETFGEHQPASTGIFEFMERLPELLLQEGLRFALPREAAELPPHGSIRIPRPVSWADAERDLSAWMDNPMQVEAHRDVYRLGVAVRAAAKEQGRPELLKAWRRLTTSDHVYYMATKFFSDADVHAYFSPYGRPHDAYVHFRDALDDLESFLAPPRSARAAKKRRSKGASSAPDPAP